MNPKETQKKCPNKVAFTYHWGGKMWRGCPDHAKAMRALGAVIGHHVEVLIVPKSEEMCMHNDDLHESK